MGSTDNVGNVCEFVVDDHIFPSPAVADGTVYVGGSDGTPHAVDTATGDRKCAIETAGVIRSSPTVADDIVLRDLSKHDEFIITHPANPRETTARALYRTVLEAACAAGYSVEPGRYSRIRSGIPWATAEAKQAVHEAVGRVRGVEKRCCRSSMR